MKFYSLTVSDVIDETSLARSFKLLPADEHKKHFHYKPGQFLTFRIPWRDGHIERCYSLSSSPPFDQELKVTVKRVREGKGSNWINETLKPGDLIDVAPPNGRFVRRCTDRPLAFLAGGSGITPVISLIKQALHETVVSASLLYANTDREQIIFKRELDDLLTSFRGRFSCRHHLDAEIGFVEAETLAKFIDDHLDCDFFICGPGPFMDLAEDVLTACGIADEHVFIERFISPDDPTVATSSAHAMAAPGGVAAFRATLDDKEHKVPYLEGKTLLDCMLSKGLDPVFSCRDAHCGSCMVIKKSGDVAMHKSTILSKRDKERGWILLCQAVPLSDDVWVDCDA